MALHFSMHLKVEVLWWQSISAYHWDAFILSVQTNVSGEERQSSFLNQRWLFEIWFALKRKCEECVNAATLWSIRPRREVIPIPCVLARIYPIQHEPQGCFLSYSSLYTQLNALKSLLFLIKNMLNRNSKNKAKLQYDVWVLLVVARMWLMPLLKCFVTICDLFPLILTSKRWRLQGLTFSSFTAKSDFCT